MQQHLVVWGDIGTDHKALIAINMDTETNQVIYRAFPEEDVTKELQDQLFTVWKNGGEFQFPEDVPTWTVDASQDNILPNEIRLHKPGLLVTAQHHWNKKAAMEVTFKLLSDKLQVLELEMDSLQQYDQSLWDKTKNLWDEILEHRKKDEISWQNGDELKLRINLIFDALKAFRRLNHEKNYDESLALFKLFGKRADDSLAKLIYPDEWKHIVSSMIALQKEVREAPMIMKHRRAVERKINAVFNDLRKYQRSDQINHLQERIKGLNRVLRAIKGAIERDSVSYKNQFEKLKHYTRGKMSDEEIAKQLGSAKSRTSDKEKKIKSITKTIRSLEAKIENLKKPPAPKQKKQKAKKIKPADEKKAVEASPAEKPVEKPAVEEQQKPAKSKPPEKPVGVEAVAEEGSKAVESDISTNGSQTEVKAEETSNIKDPEAENVNAESAATEEEARENAASGSSVEDAKGPILEDVEMKASSEEEESEVPAEAGSVNGEETAKAEEGDKKSES